jgi:hypothetical protein
MIRGLLSNGLAIFISIWLSCLHSLLARLA